MTRLVERIRYVAWCCTAYPARWLAAEVGYWLDCVGYWLRPYDVLADRRRWFWQRRQRCGSQVWADLPPDVRADVEAAVMRARAQAIAQQLTEQHLPPGMHFEVNDTPLRGAEGEAQ